MIPPVVELQIEEPEAVERLRVRQDEFAALLGVDSDSLRHLRFCEGCRGEDYEWIDMTTEVTDRYGLGLASLAEADAYRAHFTEDRCEACDGTGFQGGSFEFTDEAWQRLGK